jgi:transposase
LAYFVVDAVGHRDLSRIEEEIRRKDPRGERPYDPQMMTALLLYSYSTGRYSSRRISGGTYDDMPLRVIAARYALRTPRDTPATADDSRE